MKLQEILSPVLVVARTVIQEVSGVYTSLSLNTDKLKMDFRAPKGSGAYEKRPPGLNYSNFYRENRVYCFTFDHVCQCFIFIMTTEFLVLK